MLRKHRGHVSVVVIVVVVVVAVDQFCSFVRLDYCKGKIFSRVGLTPGRGGRDPCNRYSVRYIMLHRITRLFYNVCVYAQHTSVFSFVGPCWRRCIDGVGDRAAGGEKPKPDLPSNTRACIRT